MTTSYQLSADEAATVYVALRFWADYEDAQDRPDLSALLAMFAPPRPPTAAELAEALRTALARSYPRADDDALEVLRRWDTTYP